MREELNIGQGRFASATSGASMDIGGVNANFRVPRRTDASTSNPRKMAYVAGGIAVVLVGIVAASSLSTSRHGGSGVPVVEADSRPLRVKPDKAGGMAMETGDEVLSANEKPGTETLAPAPEAPAPAALKRQALEAAQAEAAAQAARVAAAQPPAPVAAAPVAAAPAAPSVAAPPAAHVAAPPARPAAAPVHTAASAPVVTKPAIAPVPAAPAAAAKPAAGGHSVQLAALVSEQAAQAEWDRIAKKSPALFAGHKPAITKFERDGKTFWRLRTTGFADPAQAAAFCNKAKADGLACLPEKG